MAAYRGFQQPNPRGTPTHARRGAPGPIALGVQPGQGHPSMPNVHMRAQAQQQEAMAHQMAIRRAKKPTEKNMPESIEECIIGDGVKQYKGLRETERNLDYAMSQKRLEILDSINRSTRRFKTLRISISNTVENQPWQKAALGPDNLDFNDGQDSVYRVKIEGRLLDFDTEISAGYDSDDDGSAEDGSSSMGKQTAATSTTRKRFSHFFKSITVDYGSSQLASKAPSQEVEWRKPNNTKDAAPLPDSLDFDCLEFQREGDADTNVTINLVRDEAPERYKLSPKLSQVVDKDIDDRAGLMTGIWQYARSKGLLEDEERRSIRCDETLYSLFEMHRIHIQQIPDRLTRHISPLPPIKLPYTIRVDPEFHEHPSPTIYDVQVAVEDPRRAKVLAFTRDPSHATSLRQISALDEQLALIIQALNHSKARHTFYTAMSKDPSNFIRKWMGSQKRDLETILGEATKGGNEDGTAPEFQRGGSAGMWDTDIVKEAVRYRLAKPEAGSSRT
ncbi:MAG: hypothetical protein Q9227_001825 [Pyrenula ochraceoflavens]